jgi:hypothetical protein
MTILAAETTISTTTGQTEKSPTVEISLIAKIIVNDGRQ